MSEENGNVLFSWVVKAGTSRWYYIDIKKDKNDKLYLVIKENKKLVDDTRTTHRVMIFEQDIEKFIEGLKKAMNFMATKMHKSDLNLNLHGDKSKADSDLDSDLKFLN